jgi:hypothetical protein
MHTLHPSITTKEVDNGRNVDEVLGDDDGCAHVNLQVGVLEASRSVQCEPRGLNSRTTSPSQPRPVQDNKISNIHLAEQPTVVRGQWGIIKAPVLQVVEVPFGHG